MTTQILVAPAAFKGTLGPRQVAEALSAGIRRAVPEASLLQCPISDGGDGLLDAVLTPGSLREPVSVTGPLGAPVRGVLGWVDAETAIFESATASGIAYSAPTSSTRCARRPEAWASSFGRRRSAVPRS